MASAAAAAAAATYGGRAVGNIKQHMLQPRLLEVLGQQQQAPVPLVLSMPAGPHRQLQVAWLAGALFPAQAGSLCPLPVAPLPTTHVAAGATGWQQWCWCQQPGIYS